jgi:hypothetical protein
MAVELSNTVYITLALSEPIVILIAFLRTSICIYRSHQSRHLKFKIISILIAVLLLLLIPVIVVVWFGYGVSHGGKSYQTDLIVLAGTFSLAYISSLLAWWASAYMDR